MNYFSDAIGTVESTAYPFNYPNNSNCWYLISIPDEDVNSISITFNSFETEHYNDVLYFGEGFPPSQDNLLASFDGWNVPEPVALQSSSLWFNFVSDEDVTFSGFSLSWRTYQGMCAVI